MFSGSSPRAVENHIQRLFGQVRFSGVSIEKPYFSAQRLKDTCSPCVPGSRLLQPMTLKRALVRGSCSRSGTIRSGSIFCSTPSPAHVGHAPNGLLKENDARRKLFDGDAALRTGVGFGKRASRSSPGPISAMTMPPERESAVSSESVRRARMSSRRIRRSTTTSMLCFFCLGQRGRFRHASQISPSIAHADKALLDARFPES